MSCGGCSDSGSGKKYAAAMLKPFAREAMGAQVPDMYSFPTDVRHLRTDIKLSADGDGNLDCSFLPSLFQTFLAGTPVGAVPGNTSNTSNWFCDTTGVPSEFTVNGVSANGACNGTFSLGGMISPTVLQNQFRQYRIVGWGVRLRSLIAPLNQQGRVIVCSQPSAPACLYQPTVGIPTTTTYSKVLSYLGLPGMNSAGYLTTEMLNSPDATEFMLSDLALKGGLEWVSKATSAAHVGFRSVSNNNVAGNTSLGFGLTDGLSENSVTSAVIGTVTQSYAGDLGTVFGDDTSAAADFAFCCFTPQPSQQGVAYYTYRGTAVAGDPTLTMLAGNVLRMGQFVYQMPIGVDSSDIIAMLKQGISTADPNLWYVSSAQTQTVAGSPPVQRIRYEFTNFAIGALKSLPGSVTYGCLVYDGYVDNVGTVYFKGKVMMKDYLTGNIPGFQGVANTGLRTQNVVSADGVSDETVVDSKYIDCEGWSSLSVRGYGLTPSTPNLSAEIIFHLEGPPRMVDGGGLSSGGQYPFVDVSLYDEVLEAAAKQPHFQKIGTHGTATINNVALNTVNG